MIQKSDQNYSCEVDCFTFFNSPLKIILPGSSDLYLFGMKSHHSEIRLTKYLVRHVNKGDVVIDCGAHYGFYSQLFSNLVGDSGQVFSIEPSKVSFSILAQNNKLRNNISSFQIAVGKVNKIDAFFEFPPQYSEYNAQSIDQYNSSKWIDDVMISNTKVDFVRLDSFLSNNQINPAFIKIDVEGGELEAIQGLGTSVDNLGTKIILEFINDGRPNESNFLASEILIAMKMLPHSIDDEGNLAAIKDIKAYLDGNGFDSDNIVFAR